MFEGKWKASTALNEIHRIKFHLVAELGEKQMDAITREEMQRLLEARAKAKKSLSMANHLRFRLRSIFELALSEGVVDRNPAATLYTPRTCGASREKRVLTPEQSAAMIAALDLREKVIARLATWEGMRPGEIFALKWQRLESEYADIRQRVYRGDIDRPKTSLSVRWAALSDRLLLAIEGWRNVAVDSSPEAWVFPSEKLSTPLRKDNCWRRDFAPQLKSVGLSWVNFQVMRRTHSCLLKELNVDPQIRAEQMGHTVDVNENVYTRASLGRRREAVNKLESALTIN